MIRIGSLEQISSYLNQHADLSFTRVENVALPGDGLPSMAEGTFVACEFTRGTLMPENLSGALFVDCRMAGLRFDRANMFGVQFVRCDLSHTVFHQCDLSAAQFIDCRVGMTQLCQCDVEAACLPEGDGDSKSSVRAI